jgi:hypothetical protein
MPTADEQTATEARERPTGAPDYGAVGAHVASVIATAEQAAGQIRHDANNEANAIREEARRDAAIVRDEAVGALREAQRQRDDIDRRVQEVRDAADSYAEQRRREGDEEAAKIATDAANQAAAAVAEAERRARQIEDAARRRGAKLERESQQTEHRLGQLVSFARELADKVEQTLTDRDSTETDANGETLQEALTRSAGKTASKADGTREKAEST